MPTPHWPEASTVEREDLVAGANTLARAPRASGTIRSRNPNGSKG
ncbi:cupin, partial [Mesorhizobium sp. M00.F.Ca.ET.158.01.1.1]